MTILEVQNVKKIYTTRFGGNQVQALTDVNFTVEEGEYVAIMGESGSGKTTLLNILAALDKPTGGQVLLAGKDTVRIPDGQMAAFRRDNLGFVFQDFNLLDTFSIRDNILLPLVLARKSYPEMARRLTPVAQKLGISDLLDKFPYEVSGGQKQRTAVARALITTPKLVLADEPTGALDSKATDSLLRLFEQINAEGQTILMVTHDRYFLDQVTNKILEISQGKIYSYESNYSGFLELKAAREEMELATERKRQSVLRMELEWAKRGCRARTTKQRARLERLEALKNGTAPEQAQVVEMDSIETRMGKKTIELQHLSKRYGDKVILDDYSYIFLRNQKVGIIGPNGCGKSTLMKMLVGQVAPDSGVIEIGETIRMGYFAQDEKEMDDRQRVIDYVKDIGEYIITRDGRISASQMLERFLFTPEMQYAPIGKLSGGEKRRLYLLGVLCQNINVLLLDEASNNLDIPTMTILEDYLNSFVGIVVAVSHDRYFLDNVADRILEFDGQGHIRQYEGGYTDYLEAHEKRFGTAPDMSLTNKTKADSGEKKNNSKDWKQNRPVKLKFTFSEQKEFDTIDDDIAALEAKIEQIDADMMKFATDSGKLNDLMKEKDANESALEEKMDRWVYLNDLAERIEAQKQGGK